MGRERDRHQQRVDTEEFVKILGILLSLLMPCLSRAASVSPLPDTTSLLLERPVAGETDYVDRLNANANTLDAAVLDKRVGGTISGDLTVTGSYIGSGAFLTDIPSAVAFTTENLISQVDGIDTTFTLSTAPTAGSYFSLVMDGLVQRLNTDYTLSGITITMSTAPTTSTESFFAQYSTQTTGSGGGGGASTLNVDAPLLGIGTLGNHLRVDASSFTLLGPTIDPTEVPLLASQLSLNQVIASTGNLQNQINALPNVGVSSFPVFGNGSAANAFRLDPSSATLLGPSIQANEVTFNYAGSASQAGPATTALALNANPSDCSAGSFTTAIDASGNLTCGTDGASLTGVVVSSYAAVPNTAFTNTTLGVALSTVTATTRGGNVLVSFNGVLSNTAANSYHLASFLIDGAAPSVFGGTIKSVAACVSAQAGDFCSMNFEFSISGLSAASHSFALLLATEAGTATILNSATMANQFGVREIQ